MRARVRIARWHSAVGLVVRCLVRVSGVGGETDGGEITVLRVIPVRMGVGRRR